MNSQYRESHNHSSGLGRPVRDGDVPAQPGDAGSTARTSARSSSRAAKQRVPMWLRISIPIVLVLGWLGAMGFGGPVFGMIGDVATNDQATFLPADAESTRAGDLQQEFGADNVIPASVIAVFKDGEISEADLNFRGQNPDSPITQAIEAIEDEPYVDQVIGPQPAEDGDAIQLLVLLNDDAARAGAVDELRSVSAAAFPAADWETGVTGPAAFTADLATAFAGIDGILLLVALAAVFIILVIVYRSILLPVIVLASSMAALCAAILVVYIMAKEELITLNGQVQGILSILVIGAATDYSLLLVARYREELLASPSLHTALWRAVKGTAPAVLASGSTVAIALMVLLVSELNSTRALGPVAATGIIFSILASLTFLPALLALTTRYIFWPRVPKYNRAEVPAGTQPNALAGEAAAGDAPRTRKEARAQARAAERAHAEHEETHHKLWAKIAAFTQKAPRVLWLCVTVLLACGAIGVSELKANGVAQTELVLSETQTKAAQALLEEHFDAGTGSPTTVFVPEATAEEALATVEDNSGVGSVFPTGADGAPALDVAEAKVVNGCVQMQVTLTDAGDSLAAEQTVRELREDLRAIDDEILVGGTTATQLDTNETAQADLKLVIPLVLVVVLVILVILLRSLVAPLVLVATTVLSFLTSLGLSALVFNHIFKFPGADASVPLYGFMFLVALGVDYNIFLMERAREETNRLGARKGLTHALIVTGGVITSAGVVLAATFVALAVIPLMFMVQLAFLVAVGVLIDTFIVRTLQVPALGLDLGRALWWPRKVRR